MAKASVTVRIEEDVLDQVETICRNSDISVVEFIRSAVDARLEALREPPIYPRVGLLQRLANWFSG